MGVNDHQQKPHLGALPDVTETHRVSRQLNSGLRSPTLRPGGVIHADTNPDATSNTQRLT